LASELDKSFDRCLTLPLLDELALGVDILRLLDGFGTAAFVVFGLGVRVERLGLGDLRIHLLQLGVVEDGWVFIAGVLSGQNVVGGGVEIVGRRIRVRIVQGFVELKVDGSAGLIHFLLLTRQGASAAGA